MPPTFKRPVRAEDEKRDAALDLLEERRGHFIREALRLAREHASRMGRVTATEVWSLLRIAGVETGDADPRWMGAVFRKGNGWRRLGYEPTGSHSRPVAVWALKDDDRRMIP